MRLVHLLLAAPLVFPGCSSVEAPTGSPRNLILVSVDTLRADHLSCYGNEAIATPGFDRVADEGLLFENASSVAPTTLPAHASLLTGATPLTHLVHDNVGFRLGEDLPTLASALKALGYRTGGFVGSFVLDRKFGLARGFDVYSDETPVTDQGLRERRGEKVLADALAWIGSGEETPFFAFVHFFDPHRPYDPPAAFAPETEGEDATALDARYRGEIAYVDSLLQQLLGFLDSRGLTESTVVIVTADHGESLGEHGEDTHGFFLYQSTLHVPLLIRAPAIPPERRGARVTNLVRTIDVAPTALELLGVAIPSSVEGVSLVSRGGEVRSSEVEAYAETFVPRLSYGWSELRSLRRGHWKLVLAPRSELYDLDSDPGEAENRFEDRQDVAKDLLARLEALPRPESVRPASLDRGTLASLEALGYLRETTPAEASERSFAELSDPKDEIGRYNELNALTAVTGPTAAEIERLAGLLEQEPRSTKALAMYGNWMLDEKRAQEAKSTFERLLDVQPESYEGRFGLGRALAELGDFDAAREIFDRARALDPRSADVYLALAALETSRGESDASERWLREGIELAPGRLLYQELADLLLASGRGEELARMANEWTGPGAEGAAAYARGRLLASTGSADVAVPQLHMALRLAPEDDNLEQALANTLSQAGRFEEAKRHYEAILARSPCYLGALVNLGVIYEKEKDVDAAVRSYESAIRCDATYARAYRNLGAALARKGETRRALDVLRQARRLLPEDRELASAIASLEATLR